MKANIGLGNVIIVTNLSCNQVRKLQHRERQLVLAYRFKRSLLRSK